MSTFQPSFRAVEMIRMVSRTMVPSTTRSQFASRNLATLALKSVSVGLCAVLATSFMPIASVCRIDADQAFLAEVGVLVHQADRFLPRCSTKYFTPART